MWQKDKENIIQRQVKFSCMREQGILKKDHFLKMVPKPGFEPGQAYTH